MCVKRLSKLLKGAKHAYTERGQKNDYSIIFYMKKEKRKKKNYILLVFKIASILTCTVFRRDD